MPTQSQTYSHVLPRLADEEFALVTKEYQQLAAQLPEASVETLFFAALADVRGRNLAPVVVEPHAPRSCNEGSACRTPPRLPCRPQRRLQR